MISVTRIVFVKVEQHTHTEARKREKERTEQMESNPTVNSTGWLASFFLLALPLSLRPPLLRRANGCKLQPAAAAAASDAAVGSSDFSAKSLQSVSMSEPIHFGCGSQPDSASDSSSGCQAET